MRLVITGGAGFIGSNFVRLTAETRPEVRMTVVDHFGYAAGPDATEFLRRNGASVVNAELCDLSKISEVVAHCDTVVHFAAESHNDNSLKDPLAFVRANVMGTANVLEAVRQCGVRLHHVSTDEVYGDLELDDPAKFTPETPYRPSSPYSATKAAADHLVRAWVRSFGVEATISNCSNNYGPRQHIEKFIPRQITNLMTGRMPKLYGTGRNVRDWIHVDDHNAGVWAILDRGIIGDTYLLGANCERSNSQILQEILSVMGHTDDHYEHVLDRPGHDLRYAIDASKIRKELDWEPQYTDMSCGIAETVEWYRSHRDWWEPVKADIEKNYGALN